MTINSREAVIVSAVRTAVGRFQGTLASLSASDLGAVVVRSAVERAGVDPTSIDEVLMGNVVLAGQGQAPARQAAIKAGLPPTVGATTVNKICGSGLKTVMLAAAMISAGDGDIFVAGGMESMNNGPYLLQQARFGYRLGDSKLVDAMVYDGLWCAFENHHMGNSAEWIARKYDLAREELDEYAYHSHMKAIAAIDAGRFKDEIVPVEVPQRKGAPIHFDTDEVPRRDTSLEKLARLRPAFDPEGIVTAGNAPGITDGAASTVVMSRAKAEELGARPLARVVAYDQAAVEPLEIFTAPIFAVRKLLEKTGTNVGQRPSTGAQLGEGQRPWRSHRPGPSHWLLWSASAGHAHLRSAPARTQAWPGGIVSRWRRGGSDVYRTGRLRENTCIPYCVFHRGN
jgi:acetyl-CoA C-acetyltransferase